MSNSISIILPAYNMELYLDDALKSIIKQTIKNIEIICVNDGSTDNSLAILHEYAKLDKRIKIIDQKNFGSGIARNNAINIATGEYIAFLDPDDYLANDYTLEHLYKNAKVNNCDMAGGNFDFVYFDANCKNKTKNELLILEEEKKYKETTNYRFQNDFVGNASNYKSSGWFWRFIFKKNFLDKNNIRFPNYKRFQDVPFLAKSLSLCNKIYFSKEIYYCYRINHKVIKYSKQQTNDIILALNDCFNIYYNSKKFIQYGDIFAIFIEMLDIFSDNFLNEANEYIDLIKFSNNIFETINFNCFDFSYFPKKNVKNLKNILDNKNYVKLLNFCGSYYE